MTPDERIADLERRVAALENRPPGGGGPSVLLEEMKQALEALEGQVRALRRKIREVEFSPARWNRHDGIEIAPTDDEDKDDDRDDGEVQPG
jgi:hypothetical protein